MAIIRTGIFVDLSLSNRPAHIAKDLLAAPALHFLDGKVGLISPEGYEENNTNLRALVIYTPDEVDRTEHEYMSNLRPSMKSAIEYLNANQFFVPTLRTDITLMIEWVELAAVMKKVHEIAQERHMPIPEGLEKLFSNLGDKPITSADARGNSRLVSEGEYKQLMNRGRAYLDQLKQRDTSPAQHRPHWEQIKSTLYDAVKKSWGGATIDPQTGRIQNPPATSYALTTRSPAQRRQVITIKEDASFEEFSAAVDKALKTYAVQFSHEQYHLGVFHDDEQHRIDIDPVVIVHTLNDVEEIGTYTHSIGGAYHFGSGYGFYPPHIAHTDQAVQRLTGAPLSSEMVKDESVKNIIKLDPHRPDRFVGFDFKKGQSVNLDTINDLVTHLHLWDSTQDRIWMK